MEIEDGAFPLLNSVVVGSDPLTLFKDVDLIGNIWVNIIDSISGRISS